MPRYYGIDLGTTNTVLAVSTEQNEGNPRLEILNINQNDFTNKRIITNEDLLPSIIYLDADNNIKVGKEAKGYKEEHGNSERFVFNTKLRMGQKTFYKIGDKKYTPIDVAALILEKCYKQICYEMRNKYDGKIVITVPASFGKEEREDTQKAALQAGFKEVVIFDEPTAALLSYVYENSQATEDVRTIDLSSTKNILTIDLGGGTCDICYMSAKRYDKTFSIKDLKEIQRIDLGGFNFDKAISEVVMLKKLRMNKCSQNDANELITFAEKAKEQISKEIENIIIENRRNLEDYEQGQWDSDEFDDLQYEDRIMISGNPVTVKITKKEIDDAINKLIVSNGKISLTQNDTKANTNIEDCIRKVVNLGNDKIDYVLFTGGMSKLLTIRKKLYELIKCPIISPSTPMLAVAKGAALYNNYSVMKNTIGFSFDRDHITTEAIMLDMREGLPIVLVPKGQQIKNGFHRTSQDTLLKISSPNGIKIALFEGDNEYDCKLKKLNNYVNIKFSQPKQIGMPFIIECAIDKNKSYEFKLKFEDGDVYKIDKNGEASEYKQ